jgi:hypothetical protein
MDFLRFFSCKIKWARKRDPLALGIARCVPKWGNTQGVVFKKVFETGPVQSAPL